MNCKPGDLAVIVGSRNPKANGSLVTCVEIIYGNEPIDGQTWRRVGDGPVWLVESIGRGVSWGRVPYLVNRRACSDSILRPIRDQPGNESWFKAAPVSTPTVPQPNAKPEPQSV